MNYLTPEDVKRLEEDAKVHNTHAGRINRLLEPVAGLLGLYDFGGGNFVAPLPAEMDFNGKKQRVYIFTFEDGK
jgi:hypothetical protein